MKRFVLTLLALWAFVPLRAQDKTYFISPSGNDAADGLSVVSAWKTLDKVNGTEFLPGDHILFESGGEWIGRLSLRGSGTAEAPIVLSSFGGEEKPVINLSDSDGAAILLENAGGWMISGMEVTSGAAPEPGVGRLGIYVNVNKSGAKISDIVIKDCYIHDIWGQMGGTPTRNSAILVNCSDAGRNAPEGFVAPTLDNVLVEGNRIERVDKTGIVTSNVKNGLKVRRNYMDNLGGDGIIVSGSYRGLIEFNEIHRSCLRSGDMNLPGDDGWANGGSGWWPHTAACWIIRCEETIMQFNEVYDTGRQIRNGDGFAYDFDFYCKRCVAQYNYSKENHGFLLLMYDIFQNVARYNISENDKTHLVQMQGSLKNDANVLYNNVFYVDHGVLDIDFFRGDFLESAKDIDDLGAHFYNNIFYATGQGRFRSAYSTGHAWERSFDEVLKPNLPSGSLFLNNCYFGPWKNGLPDDPKALVADPRLVAAGSGGTGLNTLKGYQLRLDSPCINAGIYVPNNGGSDFFGNSLADGHTDIGAFEALGTGVFADNDSLAEADKDAADASAVAWSKWAFPLGLVPSNPAAPQINLLQAVENGVSGTISWTNPKNPKKTVSVSIVPGKESYILPLKTDKQTLEGTMIKVLLRKGKFTEEFELPFTDNPAKRQGQ